MTTNMKNKYKFLEEFLLSSMSGFKFNWNLDINTNPYELEFKNDYRSENSIVIRFSQQNNNELLIQVMETDLANKKIIVNIDKVPKLMEHLSVAEYSFQIAAMVDLDQAKFNELNRTVNEILEKGELKGEKLIQDEKQSHIFTIDINKGESMKLFIVPIDNNHLGFQAVVTELNGPKHPIRFKKLIPIHNIANLPFLKSVAKIPETTNKELNPNIEEFINYFSNIDSMHLSPIAQTIMLNMELNKELEPHQDIKKKTVKI